MQRRGGRPAGQKDNPLNPRMKRQETAAEMQNTNNKIDATLKKAHSRRKQAAVDKEKAAGAERPMDQFFVPRSSKSKPSGPSAAALFEKSGGGKRSEIQLSSNDGNPDDPE